MTELYPDTNGIKRYSSNDPEYRALEELAQGLPKVPPDAL